MKNILEVEKIVKETLSEKRYKHSVSVKDESVKLARIYGEDENIAALVGIAHDIAKEISSDKKIEYCEKNNIEMDEIERKNPELLHAKIGKDIAINKLEFTEDMGKAIEYHTTGKKGMNMLAKIIYVADSIADDRKWEGVEYGRQLAKENLDKAILYFLNRTIERMIKLNKCIHKDSIELRNEYLNIEIK